MRPGDIKPNDFEIAILEQIAKDQASINKFIKKLHVLSRKYTGVGCYTEFNCNISGDNIQEQEIGLDASITMPNVSNGMGALLYLKNGEPALLETYTFDEHWDGIYQGFTIEKNA